MEDPDSGSRIESSAPRAAQAWRSFGRNVLAGVRLALFLRVRAESLRPSWSQLTALILLGVAASFAIGFAFVGPKGQFNAYELPGALFYVPLSLVTAWGTARLARRTEATLTVAIALLALAVPLELSRLALMRAGWGWLGHLGFWGYYLPYVWLVLAATLGAARLLAMRVATRAAALVVVTLVLGLPQAFSWGGRLWTERYDPNTESSSPYGALAREDVFYLQPKLLERELARLKPGRKGVVDLYFVGVAGDAGQDVFMREINSVSKLMRERFGAEGRTVRLINNAKTVEDTPIASVTALKATFRRFAEVMDPEDILFLYMTSHGSSDHHFALDFWPLSFNTLDPATLRKLLDDAGIKRRVIVISACYSGGFVQPLENDDTLVITSAAADRTSFGCSNEAQFTYFGKAYFDEALRQTRSFVKAFDIAKPEIAARESKDHYDKSNPQIFVGQNIGAPLAVLESRLEHPSTAIASVPRVREGAPERYERFVELWVRPDLIKLYREQCMRAMYEGSPAHYVRRDPQYFGGLNEDSREWPRLMGAWNAYADEY
ncbi:MAG: C13 family peptidase, partial [Burkholderiales bacterium]